MIVHCNVLQVGLLKWGTPVAWGGVLGYLAWSLFGYFVNTPHSVATAATGYPFWVLALAYSAAASGLTYAFWRLSSASSVSDCSFMLCLLAF